MCAQGKVAVEAISTNDGELAKPDGDHNGVDDRLPLRVELKTGRNAFRPFCACVCGMYESVVARAAALLQAETIGRSRLVSVSQHTFKRSELAKLTEADLPAQPMELMIIAHKVSGQRNPLTDQHGLYNNLLRHAWTRADVVLLCLFDVPVGYFSQLLAEQPTLRGLLGAGRLLPLFVQGDAVSEDAGAADAEASAEVRPHEDAEASWWLVRCLDGRVPFHSGLPVDNGKSAQAEAALSAVVKEGNSKVAAVGTESASCTVAVLANVAEDFHGQVLVRD
jgi:hypothetical protein